jgi:hypothetical protein
MKKWGIAVVLLSICVNLVWQASAPAQPVNSFRCQGNLISVGDREIDVLAKCGPPDIQRERGLYHGIEEWVYNFGPTDWVYTVEFREGQVSQIIRGERGY